MAKKRNTNNRHDVRGILERAPAERERHLIRYKESEIRIVIHRLRALKRIDHVATVEELDKCFYEKSHDRSEMVYFTPKIIPSKRIWIAAQVEKDVERSLWHYDVLQRAKESERRIKRRALTQVILGVLDANDELCYFQGYHDIVSVFLLTLGNSKITLRAVQNVSETYHREPMRPGLEQVMAATRLLFPLLDAADELLFHHLHESGVEPYFALPWMITWFAHQLKRFEDVTRLYDVFLVTHPLFSLYVSASVLLESREKILRCECDFGTMHGMLSSLPLSMDIEKVIERALILFHQLPPARLRQQSKVEFASDSHVYYFTFPFEYQPWPSVTTPMLAEVSPLPPRRSRDKAGSMLGPWQTSIVVTTVAVCVMAIASAYVFRDQIGIRV
ncbi:unnamed protein product [Peronospora destructor]|uniref:Rab-GAP TBC domain-containing protein n=1 Tax=Peronospora destructor TaxID=86335 RepID=A0AAV0TLJ7_9STRA|nr:unnamed protein product [Peronospora destructor]